VDAPDGGRSPGTFRRAGAALHRAAEQCARGIPIDPDRQDAAEEAAPAAERRGRASGGWSPAEVLLAVLVAAMAGGCTSGREAAAGGDGLEIAFEVVEAPSVYALTAIARVDGADGVPGLWAAVPGLPRPETGRVRRMQGGAGGGGAGGGEPVTVALFAAPGGVRLSSEAAARLGLGAGETAEVEIVALRREPRIVEVPR
jgi:hypothetical protein